MSIDITIKQKLFGNKTIPLDLILGDSLHYGRFENDHLIPGEMGTGEFIAYCPDAIGRGFSVVWDPKEKKRIDLRLPQPSTAHELKLFYSVVERICHYWQGKLIVDGNVVSLSAFLAGYDDMVHMNDSWLHHLAKQILDGESDSWTLFSAKYPLEMGKEEAVKFVADTDAYARWLHEKQSIDVCFASPVFYNMDEGITGVFFISNGISYLLPEEPTVPFGMINPSTGRPLECSRWRAAIITDGSQEPMADLDYACFLNTIPQEMRKKFDLKHFITPAFSIDDLNIFC